MMNLLDIYNHIDQCHREFHLILRINSDLMVLKHLTESIGMIKPMKEHQSVSCILFTHVQ